MLSSVYNTNNKQEMEKQKSVLKISTHNQNLFWTYFKQRRFV